MSDSDKESVNDSRIDKSLFISSKEFDSEKEFYDQVEAYKQDGWKVKNIKLFNEGTPKKEIIAYFDFIKPAE